MGVFLEKAHVRANFPELSRKLLNSAMEEMRDMVELHCQDSIKAAEVVEQGEMGSTQLI